MLRTRAPLDPKVSFDLHVLGMPPAFVLSQDQTLKFVSRISRHEPKPANRNTELREPIPALVKRNGYEGHIRHRHIKTGIRSPKTRGPGAVAHMSLHLNQQCQRAATTLPSDRNRRTTRPPRFLIGGLAVRLWWRPTEAPSQKPASPSVERHIWRGFESVNAFLQNYCSLRKNTYFPIY